MSGETLLPTDENQILLHQNILTVGEKLKQQYEASAEDSKQRAIQCTEDVVRREEAKKRQKALALAEDSWKRERQQLFKDAHQSQLRAVARHSQILEEKLRKEFSETLVERHAENKRHLEAVVEETRREAEEVKRKEIAEAQREEQEFAAEEARKVVERVIGEKQLEAELASKEKARALDEQQQTMEELKSEALQEQQRQLERQFEQRLSEVRALHEAQLAELRSRYDEQIATSERLSSELQITRDLRDEWARKHEKLKLEFSDFADQFPGFRGEFLLK